MIIAKKIFWKANNQGLGKYQYTGIAPGFGSDFVEPIEKNRRHSRAMSRIL
jgi:hypothetical protein